MSFLSGKKPIGFCGWAVACTAQVSFLAVLSFDCRQGDCPFCDRQDVQLLKTIEILPPPPKLAVTYASSVTLPIWNGCCNDTANTYYDERRENKSCCPNSIGY